MREPVAVLAVDPATARVYEHGWQSWTPSSTYALGDAPHRPHDPRVHRSFDGAGSAPPAGAFEGAGLLAVRPAADGPVHVFATPDARAAVPGIWAVPGDDRLAVTAAGAVDHVEDTGPGGLDGALARWADRFAADAGVAAIRRPPTAWCTWYHYFTRVTAADVLENLREIERHDLPVDVIQVDDGWQAAVGDWTTWSDGFRALPELIATIRDAGRRAGIWIAPFLATAGSEVARRHADWLLPDAADATRPRVVGRNWDEDLVALDTTHPGVRSYLQGALEHLVGLGIDYVKIDFVWAGAVPGRRHEDIAPVAAYRSGIQLVREAIGDAYLLGCGAPVLPSVGLVDAMRVSPDTAPHWEPDDGDLSGPGARSATITGVARAFQHGRFWTNDADCLVVRPAVERREAWAEHVDRFGGLRVSSDRVADLDAWGLETTRRILSTSPGDRIVPSG